MKLSIKTLDQQQFAVDVPDDATVGAAKQQIEKEKGHAVSYQKLIHGGKVLDDVNELKSYGIKEGDFLVLLVKKPSRGRKPSEPAAEVKPQEQKQPEKPQEQEQQQQQQQQQQQEQQQQEQKPLEQPQAAPTTTATAPPSTTTTESTTTAPTTSEAPSSGNDLVTGAVYESMVANLSEMGFPEDQVKLALRAAFNNPDRAVEYLMSGIPAGLDQPAPQAPATGGGDAPAPTAAPTPGTAPTTTTGAAPAGTFDVLRQHPQFDQLRQMVQTNPQLLQPVLEQLGQANPEILRLIQEHQAEFLQLLQEPVTGTPGGQGGTPSGAGPGGMPSSPEGQQYIQVTGEERAAIERLEALGFDRGLVIQAYFACDKDENLAANWLFQNQDEDL